MTTNRPHLAACLSALAVLTVLLLATLMGARWIERHTLRAAAPQVFTMKNYGVVLQRAAFQRSGLLPFYGSSELVKDVPDKAASFFARAPTGFEVFPVGKAGTASLIVLEKLSSLGSDLRGRKLAFSISPSWFWAAFDRPHHYRGNFSREQANAFVFESKLDAALKRDIARRMLEFPETLENDAVLAFALRRLAGGTFLDHAGFVAAWPLGRLEGGLLRVQDHLHTLEYLLHRVDRPFSWRHHRIELKWARLLASALRQTITSEQDLAEVELARALPAVGTERAFRARLSQAGEWRDFELLLRVLHDLGARPLLLSAPLDGPAFDAMGISAGARAAFYDRLEKLAARYNFPLVDFRDHDEDRRFLADTHDHLSAAGWLYYDSALDAFYHDRPVLASLPSNPRKHEIH
jgi:D-alanine transfer protein